MDAVHQAVLTEVRQVGLRVQTVMRQVRSLRIGIAVRSICPRQRMRINGIFRSRLIVVEVESFQHFVALLDLIVGDKRFAVRF